MPGWTYSWTPLLLRLELARSALTRSDLPLCCQCHPPPVLLQPIQRKYFLGGLPKFIDEDEIKQHFITFGPLTVVWPHKGGSRTPLNGYAFALFHNEFSVHWLIKSCCKEEQQFYMFISSTSQSEKKVEIRPWKLSDSEYIMDHTQPIDQRKTIFIGTSFRKRV